MQSGIIQMPVFTTYGPFGPFILCFTKCKKGFRRVTIRTKIIRSGIKQMSFFTFFKRQICTLRMINLKSCPDHILINTRLLYNFAIWNTINAFSLTFFCFAGKIFSILKREHFRIRAVYGKDRHRREDDEPTCMEKPHKESFFVGHVYPCTAGCYFRAPVPSGRSRACLRG